MRVICIHPLRRENANNQRGSILKGLQEDCWYFLYDGYTITDGEIVYQKTPVPENLYRPNRYARLETANAVAIDICAIVGENGAGKSSLVDIFIRVVNNLAAYVIGEKFAFPKAEHLHFIEDVFAEVYIEINQSIFCIQSDKDSISVKEYVEVERGSCVYKKEVENKLNGIVDNGTICEKHKEHYQLLARLCYNIVLNYSLHSYNSIAYEDEDTFADKETRIRIDGIERGMYKPDFMFDKKKQKKQLTTLLFKKNFSEGFSWISGVFHKNDGFQSPLVITPKREYGFIDINNENALSEERLLTLLFIENNKRGVKDKDRFPFSEINKKLKITGFSLEPDEKAIDFYRRKLRKHPDLPEYKRDEFNDLRDFLLSEYVGTFGLDVIRRKYKQAAINYIVYKTVKIFMTYPRYEDVRKKLVEKGQLLTENDKSFLEMHLHLLWNDYSHVTLKLRRTLNYLRYDHIGDKTEFNTGELADKIDNTIVRECKRSQNDLQLKSWDFTPRTTDGMLPPPLFRVNFHLYDKDDKEQKNQIKFNTLSSGEKQITYILCSLFYYLHCLDSSSRFYKDWNKRNEHIQYKHINVVFDEIELYFHPEMQREFISRLLHGIQQLPFETIRSVQFMIVTHSPFVLSDIPVQNILFLKKNGEKASKEGMASFGANIHTMLVNSFFLKGGAMGEFAKETINSVIDQLNMYYLCKKKKDYCYSSEEIEQYYYSIFMSLPPEYQRKIKNDTYQESDVDWEFIEKMAKVIQEPIIKQRLLEMIENK
jgi:hypothetical protein